MPNQDLHITIAHYRFRLAKYLTNLSTEKSKCRNFCKCYPSNENNKYQGAPSISNSETCKLVLQFNEDQDVARYELKMNLL